jgi:predicted enzyme related to lactoylglutathione lyase
MMSTGTEGQKSPALSAADSIHKDKKKPAQYPSVVIAVDDINKSMKKITASGGKVLGKPMEIPEFGMYVSFYDTEGNRVSIMEPKS